jgi:hypothetical protein
MQIEKDDHCLNVMDPMWRRVYWQTIFERKLEGYTVQVQIAHIGQQKRRHFS